MAADASSIRTVQTASVVLSTALAGGSAAVSAFVIPRLLESPTPLMLRQWGRMFDATKFVFPGGSVVAASAYLYLYLAPRLGGGGPAVVVSRVTGGSGWYLVAAALCAGFLPYTAVAVLPTNRVLAARVDEADRLALKDGVEEEVPSVAAAVATAASEKKTQGGWGEDKTSKWLVDHWGIMSLPRAAMLGLAGVIGAWASL